MKELLEKSAAMNSSVISGIFWYMNHNEDILLDIFLIDAGVFSLSLELDLLWMFLLSKSFWNGSTHILKAAVFFEKSGP